MAGANIGAGGETEGLVLVAALVSRVEALVLASVLEAEGVFTHLAAFGHASVSVNSVALGGYRLMVPACQYAQASAILHECGAQEWTFSEGLARSVKRFLALWGALSLALLAGQVWVGLIPPTSFVWWPLSLATVPVNPQGRGDYFLAAPQS